MPEQVMCAHDIGDSRYPVHCDDGGTSGQSISHYASWWFAGGEDYSEPWDMNSSGHVVGYSYATTGSRAFLWVDGIGMQDLGDLPPEGRDFSIALAVSDNGKVVGDSYAGLNRRAFYWTAETGMQDLGYLPGLPGSFESSAKGVNDAGQVVGSAGQRSFIWTSVDGMRDINVVLNTASLGWTILEPNAISNLGHIVGTGRNPAGLVNGYLWTQTDGFQDIGDLPGGNHYSQAFAVNNLGHVVGQAQTGITSYRAFLWTNESGIQDLGDLPGGSDESTAEGINDHGQVVGIGSVPNTGHAFIWTRADGMRDLNDLLDVSDPGWTLFGAHDINNAGQIVASGRHVDGRRGAVLLTPIPEPSTFALVLVALVAVGFKATCFCRLRWTARG